MNYNVGDWILFANYSKEKTVVGQITNDKFEIDCFTTKYLYNGKFCYNLTFKNNIIKKLSDEEVMAALI